MRNYSGGLPKVVVNNVEDPFDVMPVGALDELLERQRTSLGELNRKDMGGVVAPRSLSRELATGMISIALTPSFFKCLRRADTDANLPGRLSSSSSLNVSTCSA